MSDFRSKLPPFLAVYGEYTHSLDQTFVAGVTKPVIFNTNQLSFGINHSETVEPEHFSFDFMGSYLAVIEPTVTRTSGGGTDAVNMYVAIDSGMGFVPVPDSNRRITVNDSGELVIPSLATTFRVNSPSDVIGFHFQVASANLQLSAFPASGVAPNDLPATPSIVLNIVRTGN